jgi:zinc/manganese transport system permease protein
LLAHHPHGGEHLRDLLAGQLLWVNWQQLLPVAVIYVGVLALWLGPAQRWPRLAFYSVVCGHGNGVGATGGGAAGVYQPDCARPSPPEPCDGRCRIPAAYLVGAAGYALGLGLSLYVDLPAGATVVCCLCLLALGGALHASGRGPASYTAPVPKHDDIDPDQWLTKTTTI